MHVMKKETKLKNNKEKYFLFEGNRLFNKANKAVYKVSSRGNNSIETVLLGSKNASTGGNFIINEKPSIYSTWPNVEIFKSVHLGWARTEISKEEAFILLV
jgi:hypothetical protein